MIQVLTRVLDPDPVVFNAFDKSRGDAGVAHYPSNIYIYLYIFIYN